MSNPYATALHEGRLLDAVREIDANALKRKNFVGRIAAGLGTRFISATFGRSAGGSPVWTIRHWDLWGKQATRPVSLWKSMDPYGNEALETIIRSF